MKTPQQVTLNEAIEAVTGEPTPHNTAPIPVKKVGRDEAIGERHLRKQLEKMEAKRGQIDEEIASFKKRWNL